MNEIMNGVWIQGMLRTMVQSVKDFYKDPENAKEFEAWLKKKGMANEEQNLAGDLSPEGERRDKERRRLSSA